MDWETIWRAHWQEIYTFIYYRVNNRQEAEDLTQETFLKLIRAEERYAGEDVSVVALLKTTARNLIIDRWRKHKHDSTVLPIQTDMVLPSVERGPETIVEQRDEVRRAMELLNDEQRKVVQCRLLKGYSVKRPPCWGKPSRRSKRYSSARWKWYARQWRSERGR
jgi:RNA polymerase sigma-70 factor (ECF subfamily)